MMRRLVMVSLLALLAACSGGNGDRLKVSATTGIIGDAVQQVGGTQVQVTTGDIPADAKLVFTLDAAPTASSGVQVVSLTAAVPADQWIQLPDGSLDPHIWMDVSLWELVVGKIRDALSAADSAHAGDYKNNADTYLAKLAELDSYIRGQIERIPPEQRWLITAQDGFRYFGRAYGMNVLAIQDANMNPASAESIQTILQAVIQQSVPAVFSDNTLPLDGINALISGAAAQGLTVQNGGTLYSDSLGVVGSDAATYDGMMRHNVDTIVTALLNLPAE